MRIGIDARVLGTSRALGIYAKNIINQMLKIKSPHQVVLLVSSKLQLGQLDSTNYEYQIIPDSHTLTDHLGFRKRIAAFNLDVIWHPDNREFISCLESSVVTIHDLTPIKYPELIFSTNPLLNIRQRIYYKLLLSAWKKSKKIITVSNNSARDIADIVGVDADKIKVVYEGADDSFEKEMSGENVLSKYNIKKPYIFYIGGLNKHKNVETLIRAFSDAHNKLFLVIGGKTSTDNSSGQNSYQEILALVKKYSLSDRVIFTGFIEDQDLPGIYQHSQVFVYPSLYEGFGLPVLEAMTCGVPVICSNSSSLPEVVGSAGILVDPTDYLGFSKAIREITSNKSLHKKLSTKSRLRAKEFSWEKAAKEIYNILVSIND